MLKGEFIYLRQFEPNDYLMTHKWHSDYHIQSSICSPRKIVSMEIEKAWVQSKATNNQKELYLAICLIESDQMIGWYSINNIDYVNRCCHLGGVVIGEKQYRDGTAYNEAGKLATDYVFNQLNMHKATGACLYNHVMSRTSMEAGGWHFDGVERDAFFKDGHYHTICNYSILENEYRSHKESDSAVAYAREVVRISKRIKDEIKNRKPIVIQF